MSNDESRFIVRFFLFVMFFSQVAVAQDLYVTPLISEDYVSFCQYPSVLPLDYASPEDQKKNPYIDFILGPGLKIGIAAVLSYFCWQARYEIVAGILGGEIFLNQILPVGASNCNGRLIRLGDAVNFMQLHVACQSYQNGGAGSCGYQALKNGIVLANARQLNVNNLQEMLLDPDIVRRLFALGENPGEWRDLVAQERKIRAFRNFIYNRLALGVLHVDENGIVEQDAFVGQEDRISGRYSTALSELSKQLADDLARGNINDYNLDNESLARAISGLVRIDDHPELNEYVKSAEVMQRYINFNQIRQGFNGGDRLTQENMQVVRFDCSGEWIDDGEVELIINHERHNWRLLQAQANYNISVINNIDLVDEHYQGVNGLPVLNEVQAILHDQVQPGLQAPGDYRHIFVLGNMQHSREKHAGTVGHWHALVLDKQDDGQRNYYGLDSLNGLLWRGNHQIKRLIEAIEGQEVAGRFQ